SLFVSLTILNASAYDPSLNKPIALITKAWKSILRHPVSNFRNCNSILIDCFGIRYSDCGSLLAHGEQSRASYSRYPCPYQFLQPPTDRRGRWMIRIQFVFLKRRTTV